jgi:hypothetical protein
MTSSAPPCLATTPLHKTPKAYTAPTIAPPLKDEPLKDWAARYRAFNDGLARRLGDVPEPPPPPKVENLKMSYFVECSTCNKRGPGGATIFSGTMAAQRAGFTYDSGTLKAGSKVRWFCPRHGSKS